MSEEQQQQQQPLPHRQQEEQPSVVNNEDLLAGFVDVGVDSSQRRSSPFASPNGTLRTVREGVRVVSPVVVRDREDDIPQAHAEDPVPEPRRRGTPTAAAAASATRRRSRHQVTYESLISRPRSNPRSRTPMRYESPLEHAAFREREDPQDDTFQARTTSIRPTAGMAVGTIRPVQGRLHHHFDDTIQRPNPVTLKSAKQGPSQRKARRWNNDNFTNTAHELASSSSAKSRASAEILAQAKADVRQFLPIYDFSDKKRSDEITKFMKDDAPNSLRNQFFDGTLHARTTAPKAHGKHINSVVNLSDPTPADLYRRIDGRLQRVVSKACENSQPACIVVESFENFLIGVFHGKSDSYDDESKRKGIKNSTDQSFWQDILMEEPALEFDADEATTSVTFLFDGDSSSGGFHRLLIHAVTQFHCLNAKTSTRDQGGKSARVLQVQGVMRGGKHRLLDHLAILQKQKERLHQRQ